MPAPPITDLPDAPERGEDPEVFAGKANDFLGALPDFGDELNALGDYVEDTANQIGDAAAVIQDGDAVYAADTGSANAYEMTLPGLTAYAAGQQFRFLSGSTNTIDTPTLDINELGEVDIVNTYIGGIQTGQMVTVVHDGTDFQVIGVSSTVPDFNGAAQRVGWVPERLPDINTPTTISEVHANNRLRTTTDAVSLTLEDGLPEDTVIGCIHVSASAATLSVIDNLSGDLLWLAGGSGVGVTGNRTIAAGSAFTLAWLNAENVYIFGNGIS